MELCHNRLVLCKLIDNAFVSLKLNLVINHRGPLVVISGWGDRPLMEIARTKRAVRKCLVNDLRNLHANGSASDTTGPNGVTDSYRPGQEQDKAPSHFDDQPMQDAPETENPPKRRRAADGDFYRPSLHPHQLRSYEH